MLLVFPTVATTVRLGVLAQVLDETEIVLVHIGILCARVIEVDSVVSVN